MLPSVDYTSTPPANVSGTMLLNSSSNGLKKGTVPGSPGADLTKWTPALTTNITNALMGGMNVLPVNVSLVLSAGQTMSLWFLFLDGARSARATDSIGDPSVPTVSDSYITITHAMQSTSINTGNWGNVRCVRYNGGARRLWNLAHAYASLVSLLAQPLVRHHSLQRHVL